jgi:hypothetical protein
LDGRHFGDEREVRFVQIAKNARAGRIGGEKNDGRADGFQRGNRGGLVFNPCERKASAGVEEQEAGQAFRFRAAKENWIRLVASGPVRVAMSRENS